MASVAPSMTLKKSSCSSNVGRIVRVQMIGEDGSYISDDRRRNSNSNNDENGQYLTVTLYEDTAYQLNIQFNCGRQLNRGSSFIQCDVDQNVNVWIDFNDNGFEESERRTSSYSSSGQYDMDIYTPLIDERYVKSGFHRMRLTVTPSEEYRRACSNVRSRQIRDYTVNVLPKARYQGKFPTNNFILSNKNERDLLSNTDHCP